MDDRQTPQGSKEPFRLDISFDDDDLSDVHGVLEDIPQPKGEVYFSNPPRVPKAPSPPPAKAKKKARKGGGLNSVTILVILGLSISAVLSWLGVSTLRDIFALGKDPKDIREITVYIPPDATTSQVIDILADNDLINRRALCKFYSKFTFDLMNKNKKQPVQPTYVTKEYPVNISLGLEEMLDLFKPQANTGDTVRLTFPEGYTVKKTVTKINEFKASSLDQLNRTMAIGTFNYSFLKDLNTEGRYFKYEGYLFPDTYDFYLNDNASSVLTRFFDNFQSKWVNEYDARAKELGMTVDEVVNLASIIQMEADNKAQMKDISGVLHNRLNNPSTFPLLECDSTRDYVFNNIATEMEPGSVAYYNDVYNTYKRPGLPIGPICSPGIDAIEAALYPNTVEYMFFQHDKNGKIYLTKTKAEHNKITTDLVINGLAQ